MPRTGDSSGAFVAAPALEDHEARDPGDGQGQRQVLGRGPAEVAQLADAQEVHAEARRAVHREEERQEEAGRPRAAPQPGEDRRDPQRVEELEYMSFQT